MPDTFDARAFVSVFATAINGRNIDPFLAYYADDAELQDPSTPEPVRGKENIRRNFERWATAFSEVEVHVREVVAAGNDIAILYEAKGRHTGDLVLGPGETIPATNKEARIHLAEFVKTDAHGKIVRDRTVFDLTSLMVQLGLLPSLQPGPQKDTMRARR